jgi:signal transduction histidine kinase
MAVSHELREPVNTIVVSLQVLQTRPCMRDAAAEAARDTDSSSAAAGVLGVAELMNVMLRGVRSFLCPPSTTLRHALNSSRRARSPQASLLQGIVGGIISTRQLDAGDLVLKQTIFPPEAVIEGVVGMCRAAQPSSDRRRSADATSIAWEPRGIPDAPEPLPALVVGDRSKLALIVQNLVTNAVKFSPAGSVVLVRTGSAVSPGGGPPQLVVTVTDSGRGMSPDVAKACFTAGIAAPTSQGGGTGLGLFLSRAFAQLMGGAISVQTAIGEGATFRLELPLPVVDPDIASTRTALALESESEAAQAQELSVLQSQHAAMAAGVAEAHAMEESTSDEALKAVAAAAAAAAAKKEFEVLPPPPMIRVLVAEDHVLNLRLITRLLSLNGFLVTGVGDGRAALETLIASFSTGEPFGTVHACPRVVLNAAC